MGPIFKTLGLTAVLSAGGGTVLSLSPEARAWVAGPFPVPASHGMQSPATNWSRALIEAGRGQIGVTLIYDGSYAALDYPGGDVPRRRGVCTDVVIRALRDAHKVDLQKLVHEDMRADFAAYPTTWGLPRPDRNIDHRRVPNLHRFLTRAGHALPVSDDPAAYRPGDLVTWTLGPGLPHIGIVSDRVTADSLRPMIIHNVGWGTREEDFLFAYPVTGHFRMDPEG